MTAKLYVGNLSYTTTDTELEQLFAQHGKITETKLVTDRDTGRSKGFAFVTYSDPASAQNALELNGTEFGGRRLRVNFARDNREGGSGSGSNRGGRRGQGQSNSRFERNEGDSW